MSVSDFDYVLRLYLDSPLYFKLAEFQLKMKLSKTYAGLLVFIEGLYALKLIDRESYEYYKARYSKPLQTSPIKVEPLPKPRCDFCGREAVARATHVSGIVRQVCQKHLADLQSNPKWRVEA